MKLKYREAKKEDAELYYTWANEEDVRKNSFSQETIAYENHVKWFDTKLLSELSLLIVFFDEVLSQPVGQVRFENISGKESIIGISIDKNFRRQGLASILLKESSLYFHGKFPEMKIIAYIKKDNISSLKSFRSAGFENEQECEYLGINSIKLSKYD